VKIVKLEIQVDVNSGGSIQVALAASYPGTFVFGTVYMRVCQCIRAQACVQVSSFFLRI
jgi:hypothetical protein